MRWPVEVILDMIESEMSFEEILSDHPELEREDIIASLSYVNLTQQKPHPFTEKKMKVIEVINPSLQEKLDKANDFIRRGKFPKI